MKVALARHDAPAEVNALLSAWIEGEVQLVDDRESVGEIDFYCMDRKTIAPHPHVLAFFRLSLQMQS